MREGDGGEPGEEDGERRGEGVLRGEGSFVSSLVGERNSALIRTGLRVRT